eukprot:scaffold123105_cov30-Tisochrysis_lutea.AAC.14
MRPRQVLSAFDLHLANFVSERCIGVAQIVHRLLKLLCCLIQLTTICLWVIATKTREVSHAVTKRLEANDRRDREQMETNWTPRTAVRSPGFAAFSARKSVITYATSTVALIHERHASPGQAFSSPQPVGSAHVGAQRQVLAPWHATCSFRHKLQVVVEAGRGDPPSHRGEWR